MYLMNTDNIYYYTFKWLADSFFGPVHIHDVFKILVKIIVHRLLCTTIMIGKKKNTKYSDKNISIEFLFLLDYRLLFIVIRIKLRNR